jgi:hypothetical protein
MCARQYLLKIDAEGAEMLVLQGAKGILTKSPSPELFVKINFTENFGGAITPHYAETFEFLLGLGLNRLAIESLTRMGRSDIEDWLSKFQRTPYALNFYFAPRPVIDEALAASAKGSR